MRTASALLAFLLLFGLAACGSKPQDGTGSGDAASIPADGSTGKGVLADGRQPDKDMLHQTRERSKRHWPGCGNLWRNTHRRQP